jgi:hypothetical protein
MRAVPRCMVLLDGPAVCGVFMLKPCLADGKLQSRVGLSKRIAPVLF